MKVLFSHAPEDQAIAQNIGDCLAQKGIWVEYWPLEADDSLMDRIGGQKPADRLIVPLSSAAMATRWMRSEVTSGALIELADQKGFGALFLTPILIKPCEVPLFLRDRVSANFANKPLEDACEELFATISQGTGSPPEQGEETISNRVFRTWEVDPVGDGSYAVVMEFGVLMQRSQGLHVEVDVGGDYISSKDWFGPPNMPRVPSRPGGPFFNSSLRREPPIYARKFVEPDITPQKSYYLYVEANEPLHITERLFLDAHDREI